jgi:hypothetical protein
MGRAHHLKETLPANLAHNSDVDTEFVVLNYNSKDDLHEWMQQFLVANPLASRVAYFHERTAKFFDPRHAKNVAHLLATGDVVVNLDADNFTGSGYASGLDEIFRDGKPIFITSNQEETTLRTGRRQTGLAGRVVLFANDFHRLRGYDEGLEGWGGEDTDLVRRALHAGLSQVKLPWLGDGVILHSDEDRLTNFEDKTPVAISSMRNRETSLRRLASEVNLNGWGRATVRTFDGREISVGMSG